MRKPAWTFLGAVGSVATVLSVLGRSYGHKYFKPTVIETDGYKLYTAESDDFGSFWDNGDAEKALIAVENESDRQDTVVVLFIHGWHHNAKSSDGNLVSFSSKMKILADKLHSHPSAKQLTVIGIYVGWRGRSLPSFLDYGTIWWRKDAAERVGEGDVSEFIARMQKIYDKHNVSEHDSNGTQSDRFMGLVLTGHSLGAQVLYKSVAPFFEHSLVRHTEKFMGDGVRANAPDPKTANAPKPVKSLGDIVMLLNPALEAYQFQRFDRLYRSRTYDSKQDPVLFVVSSVNDTARSVAFPISRWFSLPFRPTFYNKKQAQLFNNALGDYEPQVTHTLKSINEPDNTCETGNIDCLLQYDLSKTINTSGVQLTRLNNPENRDYPDKYSPVIVARVDADIVDGHNGIFLPKFVDFSTDYITEIIRKKLVKFATQK